MIFYCIERKIGGEWVPMSRHGLWNEGRKALDRLQNQHGASFVRMTQVATLPAREAGHRDRQPLRFRTNMDGSPLD